MPIDANEPSTHDDMMLSMNFQNKTNSPQIRLLFIDETGMLQKHYFTLKNTQHTDFNLIGFVADGRQGIELAISTHPDVVILNINTQNIDGIELINLLSTFAPKTKVIVVTDINLRLLESLALISGADFYMLKHDADSLLTRKIRQLAGHRFH